MSHQIANQLQNTISSDETKEGNYASVVHEITEFLRNPPFQITAEEFQIIMHMFREVLGWTTERPQRTKDICAGTGILSKNIYTPLNRLLKRKILDRRPSGNGIQGEYIYCFNLETFGRNRAHNVIPYRKKTTIHSMVVPKLNYHSAEGSTTIHSMVAGDSRMAVVKDLGPAKDILKKQKSLKERKKAEESFTLFLKAETEAEDQSVPPPGFFENVFKAIAADRR